MVCKISFSLIVPAQHRNSGIRLDYSPRKSPIILQTRDFTAQICLSILARKPFDHMFAHRQRKISPPGISLGGPLCFLSAFLSAPALSGLECGHCAFLRRAFFCELRFRFCDTHIDFCRRFLPHLIGDVGVGVQRSEYQQSSQVELLVYFFSGIGCLSMSL